MLQALQEQSTWCAVGAVMGALYFAHIIFSARGFGVVWAALAVLSLVLVAMFPSAPHWVSGGLSCLFVLCLYALCAIKNARAVDAALQKFKTN